MARLPTREDLGAPPSARSGRPIARVDTSAIGSGVIQLGRSLSQAGSNLAAAANQVDPADELSAERRFQEFKWNESQALEEKMRSVEPGQAAGFAQRWANQYRENARQYFGEGLNSIPEPLRQKYDLKLFGAEREFFSSAAQFARNEQKRSSVADIEDITNTAYLSRARAGEPLDKIGEDFKDLVGANKFLTPIEKDIEVRKGFGNLEEAHIQGRIERGDDINEILRDIRGLKSKQQGEDQPEVSRADTERAAISTRLETGTDDPLQGVANISRDAGGTKSYGNFGLNSGGSVQEFVRQYGDQFDLTAKPGTKSFDEQWRNAASAAGVELHEAEMEWYRAHTADVGQKLVNAGVPKELAEDARVQAYFSDRMIQQGPASIDGMKKHASRIKAAASEADGDPVAFLQNVTEADRGALTSDFPTALRTGVYSERGHDTRLNGRLNLSLGVTEAGRAQLPEYGGPYQNLKPKRRLELENKVRTAYSERTQQDLRNSIEQIRRTGAPPTDEQGRTALDRATSILTKNQVEKFQLDWIKAALEFNALHDLNTLSESDLQGRLQEIAPTPGEDLYQIKAKVFDEAVRRAEALRDLRDKDPASSISDFPEVMEATKLVRENPEEPGAIQRLVKARMDAQAKVGIPEGLQSPITKAEARVIMAPIKGLEEPALREAMSGIIDGVEQQYGPYARSVILAGIDYHIRNREVAENFEGILSKVLKGERPKAADVRRLEFLQESDMATKAFGGDYAGEPHRQMPSPSLTGDFSATRGSTTAPSAVEGDPFAQYGIKRPPQRAIEALIANPSLASEFDAYYGAGSSAQYLAPPAEKQ